MTGKGEVEAMPEESEVPGFSSGGQLLPEEWRKVLGDPLLLEKVAMLRLVKRCGPFLRGDGGGPDPAGLYDGLPLVSAHWMASGQREHFLAVAGVLSLPASQRWIASHFPKEEAIQAAVDDELPRFCDRLQAAADDLRLSMIPR